MAGTETSAQSVPSQVVEIDLARERRLIRKEVIALTEEERQILLGELAEITAELDELKMRAAEIADRVRSRDAERQPRSA
jgi:hypothetical protein